MPGKRITDLTALSGANSANNDDLVIFDATASETKRISRSQLAEGMQADVQVLSNKTLALGSNTVTGTTAQFNAALTDNDFATQAGAETLTNKTISGGTINGTVIGGSSAAAGTFTTVNATTVDTTNIEVTTLKAKDGTSAGSIADSTGVVTLASSVLTTTDINGGTIDGTVIGGTTPAAITGTTVTHALGAVGTPSITFTGDTNTGIWSPAADTIAFSEGGTEVMRIDSSGNLGIGTVSPGAKLELASGNAGLGILAATNRLRFTDSDPTLVSGQSTGAIEWYTSDTDAPGVHAYIGTLGANTGAADLTFGTGVGGSTSERMRIDSSGNVGIGTATPAHALSVARNSSSEIAIQAVNAGIGQATLRLQNSLRHWAIFVDDGASGPLRFYDYTAAAERARIDDSGVFSVGCTALSSTSTTDTGAQLGSSGAGNFFRASNTPLIVMRQTNDGTLIDLRQGGASEGSISVSGTTVSYNGGHLSRWAQFPDNSRPELLKGTVMSNLDQMSQWGEEDNEQLNCVQVSTVEGDANVAGVFVAWDSTDDGYNDILLAMTGDMVIRIGAGVTVARGDLLMSAGDGTAKPQGDDIVRSKTIAKVTSTHVSHTYADGSYAVPCVLMAC